MRAVGADVRMAAHLTRHRADGATSRPRDPRSRARRHEHAPTAADPCVPSVWFEIVRGWPDRVLRGPGGLVAVRVRSARAARGRWPGGNRATQVLLAWSRSSAGSARTPRPGAAFVKARRRAGDYGSAAECRGEERQLKRRFLDARNLCR